MEDDITQITIVLTRRDISDSVTALLAIKGCFEPGK